MIRRFVQDFLIETANNFPDKVAIEDPTQSITYGSLLKKSQSLAIALRQLNFKPQDRCALLMGNSVDFIISYFAVLAAGGIVVPCEPQSTATTVGQILSRAEVKILIADAGIMSRLFSNVNWPDVHVILTGKSELPNHKNCHSLNTLTEGGKGQLKIKLSDSALAAIMYTTGTTGTSKGVCLSHKNILAAVTNICKFVGYSSEHKEVNTLPLSHNFGLGQALCCIASGANFYTEGGLARVGRLLNQMEKIQANSMPGTPASFSLLMDTYGDLFKIKAKSLKLIVVNSARMPPEKTAQLQSFFPEVEIFTYYGLTEASRSCFINLTKSPPNLHASVGKPMTNIKVRVVDDSGNDVPRNTEGKIIISGPTVTQKYWDDTELTNKILADHWLKTGDLGRFNEEGYLFLSGRINDIINLGGYKINPSQTEEVIRSLSGIKDAAVTDIEIPGKGEVLAAAIELVEGCGLDAAAIESHCLKSLERYKTPTEFFFNVKFPRTETGKLIRHELKASLEKKLLVAS